MAAKKNSEGLAFLVETLKKNRDVSYADAAEAAKKAGFKVYPIMYGKAKLMLGYVKAGSGAGKKAKAKAKAKAAGNRGPGRPPMAAVAGAVRRGPGRPRKNAAAVGTGGLDAIIAAVRGGQQELERYRTAMERIRGVIETLGG